jgi:phosphoenolpyruvate phosphomutase
MYADAGADFIMPHSKQSTSEELFEFAKRWDRDIPLVSVPSTYHAVTADELADNKVELVIYANHTIRAMKKALEEVIPQILVDGTTTNIESKISPLKEILELSDEHKVKSIEKEYL